jgi:hypothetical protein
MGTWSHLVAKVGSLKAGESNGKLPLRTCLGCSVPEPYRSPDWALVPVKPAQRPNTKLLSLLLLLLLLLYTHVPDNRL